MSFDGIPKINSYSLTDLHDFESCPFRFFVRHHLDKKYEIDECSPAIALGNILDLTIKRFHKEKCYGTKSSKRIARLVFDCVDQIKTDAAKATLYQKNYFYAATISFLNDDLIRKAIQVFTDYYVARKGQIHQSLGEVGFCQYTFPIEGDNFKLWGGPDTLELGSDGIPEVADYKSRQDVEKGKLTMDMDLMPKIYVLLCADKLRNLGYSKARFIVRFWQEPLDESFYEEFELNAMSGEEFLFRQKIERILRVTEFRLCGKKWCRACQSAKKEEYITLLQKRGYQVITGEQFLTGKD